MFGLDISGLDCSQITFYLLGYWIVGVQGGLRVAIGVLNLMAVYVVLAQVEFARVKVAFLH